MDMNKLQNNKIALIGAGAVIGALAAIFVPNGYNAIKTKLAEAKLKKAEAEAN